MEKVTQAREARKLLVHYCVRIGTRMLNSEPLTHKQASALALATGGIVFKAVFL